MALVQGIKARAWFIARSDTGALVGTLISESVTKTEIRGLWETRSVVDIKGDIKI